MANKQKIEKNRELTTAKGGKHKRDTQMLLQIMDSFHDHQGIEITNTSSTFKNWESLPKFFANPSALDTTKPVTRLGYYNGRKVYVEQSPVILKSGNYLPGPKEDILMSVLIKMLTNDEFDFGDFEPSDTALAGLPVSVGNMLVTTVYELHRQLKACGHESKVSEIELSLEILSRSQFLLIDVDNRKRHTQESLGPMIAQYMYIYDTNDPNSRKRHLAMKFNSMVMDAIPKHDYRYIDFDKESGLKYIARAIYRIINQYFSNATKPWEPNKAKVPFTLELDQIVELAGMKRQKRISGDIHLVRRALNELVEHDILDEYHTHNIYDKPKGRGRPSTIGAYFELHASHQMAVNSIINNQIVKKRRPEKDRKNLPHQYGLL